MVVVVLGGGGEVGGGLIWISGQENPLLFELTTYLKAADFHYPLMKISANHSVFGVVGVGVRVGTHLDLRAGEPTAV